MYIALKESAGAAVFRDYLVAVVQKACGIATARDLEQPSERIVGEGRRASAGRRDQPILDVIRVCG